MNNQQRQTYVAQLPQEAIALLSILLSGEIETYENAYMAEVKLDNPLEHIKTGDDGFIIHDKLGQERSAAKHLWNTDWVVVHKKDLSNLSEYEQQSLKRIAKEYINKIMEDDKNKECLAQENKI
jgi:hypothetical protein